MHSYELPETLSLLGDSCGSSTGKYEPDISRGEAQYVHLPCPESNINGLTCRNPEFDTLSAKLGGLSLEGRGISNHVDTAKLPHIIPEGITDRFAWRGLEYVVYSVRDILPSYGKDYAGAYHPPKHFHFNNTKMRGLDTNTKKILSLSGCDALIETMTNIYGLEGLARVIASLGFDYVIPPDYSAFLGECVAMHRLNQIRSLAFAQQLIANGVQVIPHIFPSNPINLAQYAKWLSKGKLSLVAINAQMHKTDAAKDVLIQIIGTLLDAAPDLHILVQGAQLSDLYRLGNLLKRVHITNRTAIQLALCSTLHQYDFATDTMVRSYSGIEKTLLTAMNVDAYNEKWKQYMLGKKSIYTHDSVKVGEHVEIRLS